MIEFEIPLDPIPQPRSRFGNGRAYQPKRIIEYKRQVQAIAMKEMAGQSPPEGAIRARLTFYRKFSPTSRAYGDFDNLAKAITDAFNGGCIQRRFANSCV